MDRHAIDDAACQSARRDIIDERQTASRLHCERPDGAGVGEAGIQILAVHRQANTVRSTAVSLGPGSAATDGQGADGNAHNLPGQSLGGINALLIAAVEYADPVCPKEAAGDA